MKEVWFILAKSLVIFGSVNWLSVGAFNTNLVQVSFLRRAEHALYVLIGLSAIFLAVQRDFFLPFLGRAVFPQGIVSDQTPRDATISEIILAPPGSKVIYWAAETSDRSRWDSPKQAYGFYQNSGVVTSNALGQAVLRVRDPSAYTIPTIRKVISPHIHYRISDANTGMWGPVRTVDL